MGHIQPLPDVVNKVLLEYSPVHLLECCSQQTGYYSCRAGQLPLRLDSPKIQKCLLCGPSQKDGKPLLQITHQPFSGAHGLTHRPCPMVTGETRYHFKAACMIQTQNVLVQVSRLQWIIRWRVLLHRKQSSSPLSRLLRMHISGSQYHWQVSSEMLRYLRVFVAVIVLNYRHCGSPLETTGMQQLLKICLMTRLMNLQLTFI